MTIPLRNIVNDKIVEAGSMTDAELYKSLAKGGHAMAEDRFNKLLLDLEIMGLIKVSWITKGERRIERYAVAEAEVDEVAEQNRIAVEKDYEASFPGFKK